MPKPRIPSAGMVASSGVRLNSSSVPSPTERASEPASRWRRSTGRPALSDRAKLRAKAASGASSSSRRRGARGARGRTMARYSKAAQSMIAAMKTKNHHPGSRNTAARARGAAMAAVRRRFMDAGGRGSARQPPGGEDVRLVGLLDAAVAALTALVVEDRLVEVAAPEVGPEGVRHPDLGVGDLPEEEVGDAQLARRAHQQVGVRLPGGVEVAADRLLVDVRPLARRPVGHDAAAGVDDLAAARVVEGDVEAHRPAVPG